MRCKVLLVLETAGGSLAVYVELGDVDVGGPQMEVGALTPPCCVKSRDERPHLGVRVGLGQRGRWTV